jgi:hypothetical protein
MNKEHKVEIRKMSRQELGETLDEIVLRLKEINDTKGKDYSKEDDVFFNFTSQGDALCLSPFIIWQVYVEKHLSAIRTFCKDGKVSSEGIEDRVIDAIMYLILLYGMTENMQRK